MRSSVVLPQPLGPSSAKNSPALMSSESRSTARKLPKLLPTPSIRSSGMSAVTAAGGSGLTGAAATSIFGVSICGDSSVMSPACPIVAAR